MKRLPKARFTSSAVTAAAMRPTTAKAMTKLSPASSAKTITSADVAICDTDSPKSVASQTPCTISRDSAAATASPAATHTDTTACLAVAVVRSTCVFDADVRRAVS